MAKRAESPSEVVLARVRALCHAFAEVEEKLSHGAPSFHVRGRMMVMFVDDHHGDGRVAVWCNATFERQRELVAADPAHYFVPPYVGVRGWVGVRLDQPTTDWVELAILVEGAWLAVAPSRLTRVGAASAAGRTKPPPPPERPTTNAKVARASLARLTKICLALPSATIEREPRNATFLVGKKAFAHFLDNHHGDARVVACVRGPRAENAALVKKHPDRYGSPAYIGPRGWLGLRLDAKGVDWDEVQARVEESYRAVAPKTSKPRAVESRPRAVASVARRRVRG